MIDSRTAPYAALLLRVSLGLLFLAHAGLKFFVFTPAGTAKFFDSVGLPPALAYVTIAAEVLGGIALILGLWTRIAAIAFCRSCSAPSSRCMARPVSSSPTLTAAGSIPAFWSVALIVQALLGDGAYALRLSGVMIPSASSPAPTHIERSGKAGTLRTGETVMTMPSLFLSHGSPTLPLTDTPARSFLSQFSGTIARPTAILVISAHWETSVPTVSAVDRNDTIHDFHGFPQALYELRYPAPGSPAVAARIADLLRASGIDCRIDRQPRPRSWRLGAAAADVSAGRHSGAAAFAAAASGDPDTIFAWGALWRRCDRRAC